LHLIEPPLSDRKFIWAKFLTSDYFTLLDRFLCSIAWSSHYSTYIITSFPRLQSDRNSLILRVTHFPYLNTNLLCLKKNWLSQDDFVEFFEHWWVYFVIIIDIANQWRLKLQFICKNFRGYDSNLKAEKKTLNKLVLI
jgi:hypothetical protein